MTPGENRLTTELLKGGHRYLEYFMLFNAIILEGITPEAWYCF